MLTNSMTAKKLSYDDNKQQLMRYRRIFWLLDIQAYGCFKQPKAKLQRATLNRQILVSATATGGAALLLACRI
jgi:hypothetical protein